MNKWHMTLILVVLAMLAFLTVSSRAMTSSTYRIQWDTVAGGGDTMQSSSFALHATTGQAVVGASNSANIQSSAGFWQKWMERFVIYAPVVLRNTGS